jgi:hypothetical protein
MKVFPFIFAILVVVALPVNTDYAQTAAMSHGTLQTLSGVISDRRCGAKHTVVNTDRPPSCIRYCLEAGSAYVLVANNTVYSLQGDKEEIEKYAGYRATVSGTAGHGTIVVKSIARAETSTGEVESLVQELRTHPWSGPYTISINPPHWLFDFTEPMLRIIEIGQPAQAVLLKHLTDDGIKDQVIILLGAVGDEKAVQPIINAMVDGGEKESNPSFAKTNRTANLALTNITVSNVIWHHGGGITIERCPDDPKACWSRWWQQNHTDFSVSKISPEDRRYSNYPNYGIYQFY